MRNTLYKMLILGAVVIAAMALNVHGAYAADDNHAESAPHAVEDRIHEPAIIIGEDGEFHMSTETYDHHHDEVEGLPQLDFTTYTSQIFWMFVFFILLYVFFSKKSLPEISGTVETRREKIEGDLDNAHSLKEQAESVRGEYEEALSQARDKASATFKKAEEKIKEENNAKLEAFKDRSTKLTQDTEAKIEKAKEAALKETQSIAAEIASIAAEKIVGVSTDIKQAEDLVKNIQKKAA